jgi:hypothetical protein
MTIRTTTLHKLACAGLLLCALASTGCSSAAMRPNVAHNDRLPTDVATPAQSSCAGELCFPYVDAR